jgi:hypothetical protein
MVQSDRVPGLVLETGHGGDCDAVMLVVVGEKGEHPVAVNDFGFKHGRVPIHHRLELFGGEHGMCEFRRHDSPVPVAAIC